MLVYIETQKRLDRYCIYLNAIFVNGKHELYHLVNINDENIKEIMKHTSEYRYFSSKELEVLLKNRV